MVNESFVVINGSFIPTAITDTTSMVFTPEGFEYAFKFSILILVIIFLPYIIELVLAYCLAHKRDKQAKELLESSVTNFITTLKSNNCPLTDEQLDKFYEKVFVPIQSTMKQPVTGISGSTRGIIAFAIIFTIGITTMLVMFAEKGDSQLVNNVVSMLAATLAAIIGFYFGGRTVQEATSQAEKAKPQAAAPPPTVVKEKEEPKTPVLKVKGIKIGALSKKVESGVIPIKDVKIFEFWDTYDEKELEYCMDPDTEYSLYCCVESSIPEGQYDIYIEPTLKKGGESIPFLSSHDKYRAMTPHNKQNTWYVDSFGWIPKYKDWHKPGNYQVSLKIGYLKKGKPLGTPPVWLKEEEFTVILK